jgi:hypothetical protein
MSSFSVQKLLCMKGQGATPPLAAYCEPPHRTFHGVERRSDARVYGVGRGLGIRGARRALAHSVMGNSSSSSFSSPPPPPPPGDWPQETLRTGFALPNSCRLCLQDCDESVGAAGTSTRSLPAAHPIVLPHKMRDRDWRCKLRLMLAGDFLARGSPAKYVRNLLHAILPR